MDDWELLQAYARQRSEAAFTELVQRHLDWVYCAARRQVDDSQLAEDVAQAVFVLLARKADSLGRGTILGGWLFRTTRFVASRALRAEIRRKHRELTAVAMNTSLNAPDESEAAWNQLAPHLERAVAALSESDRSAVLLRFYEKKPLQEVGRRLGVSEEAAKKRVSRAVDKMREYLLRRGVALGGVTLASVLAAQTVQAAPATLAASVLKTSLAGASASAVLPELARQTLNAWRWTQLKLAAGIVTLAGACLFLVFEPGHLSVGRAISSAANVAALQAVAPASPDGAGRSQPLGLTRDASASLIQTGLLSGVVLDQQDRPVPDAQVWVGFGQQPVAKAVTDWSGRFSLNTTENQRPVTALAEGFAADQQEVDTNTPSGPLVFHLSPVRPLRFRVTDEAGRPIAGADVALENWWGRPSSLEFRRPTDGAGRVEWHSAPKGELEFCVLKSGYRTTRQHKLVADDAEHAFVLRPELTATGKVTDADSGGPIARFRLTRGYSRLLSSEETGPIWDLQQRWFGTNGSYKVIFDEENIPRLRVEAEGYEVAEAKPPFTNSLEAVCDFQLRRLDTNHFIRGTVLLPDGSPAADVEVALCTFRVGADLDGMAFEKHVYANEKINPADYRQTTDPRGGFSFAPRPGAHTVVAVSPAGLGKVHCFDYTQPLEIRLQAWGRIQGVVRTRAGEWANRKIVWSSLGCLQSGMELSYKGGSVAAVSDASGSFTLEHVPPGDGQVRIAATDDESTSCVTPVQVRGGETLQIQLGGTGLPVSGRLVAPPGVEVKSWSSQLAIAQIHSQWDAYPIPAGLQGEALWRYQMEYAESEAGRARLRGQADYELKVQPDGTFIVPEVLPGDYAVIANLNEGALGSGPSSSNPLYLRQLASLFHKFTVPAPSAASLPALDLGDLVLNPTR